MNNWGLRSRSGKNRLDRLVDQVSILIDVIDFSDDSRINNLGTLDRHGKGASGEQGSNQA